MPAWRHASALLLPVTVDGVIPAAVLYYKPYSPTLPPLRALLGLAGLVLAGVGLWLLRCLPEMCRKQ
jgi:hypothetical protein